MEQEQEVIQLKLDCLEIAQSTINFDDYGKERSLTTEELVKSAQAIYDWVNKN